MDMLRVYIGHVLITNYYYLIWLYLSICIVYALVTHYNICDLWINNFTFFFYLNYVCIIYVGAKCDPKLSVV